MELNHTIVWATDPDASAEYLTTTLGLPPHERLWEFRVVTLPNGVSLDYLVAEGALAPQHYAFLVTDEEFDAVVQRLDRRGEDHWADPGHRLPGINHDFGGRGTYFRDPDGHNLEVLTRPYSTD